MFILKNETNQMERRFTSRDDLLLYLEDYQARLEAEKQKELLQLTHVSEDGEIFGQTQIGLPSETTLDSLLLGFGLDKAKKGILGKRQKFSMTKDRSKPSEKSIESLSQPSKERQRAIKSKSFPFKRLLVFLETLGIISVFLVLGLQLQGQSQKIQELTNSIERMESIQKSSYQIDVFSRYFLPSYYAGDQSQLSAFVSQDLGVAPSKRQGQLQSVILEGVNPLSEKNYQVTYILVLKEGDEQKSLLRVMFTVRATNRSLYGYEVISQPKESRYPK